MYESDRIIEETTIQHKLYIKITMSAYTRKIKWS